MSGTEKQENLPGAPTALGDAAAGKEISGRDEFDVIDWILGGTPTPEDDVDVFLDTPAGERKLVFHIQGVDGDEIAAAEREHRTGQLVLGIPEISTSGHAAVAALGITTFHDPATGKTTDISSVEFRGEIPEKALAFEGRFRKFPGIIEGLADEVRSISGYRGDAVVRARRSPIQDAAGNSSSAAG